MKTAHERLAFFLYILTRDHLPSGTIEAILRQRIEATRHLEPKFSCPHVKSLAEHWTRRLIGDLPGQSEVEGRRVSAAIGRLRAAREWLRNNHGALQDQMRAATLITEALEQLETTGPEDS
jgi:hypothetical protein